MMIRTVDGHRKMNIDGFVNTKLESAIKEIAAGINGMGPSSSNDSYRIDDTNKNNTEKDKVEY